ncbi:hypothetical protein C5167_001600 [Papaver somniferum]|uniref:Protein kinase domain-containing protein n=1 Tax=Papaver somniferum TaxID=3469 RepID=A0A4Y7KZD2_PAPSO|nr:probably inactive leucine-rich repeat receptor-like protein kinase At5g06940 [Papaver somniferum]RZC77451.1 hypothetical protein C5167_001600 [Papaver somniferum]
MATTTSSIYFIFYLSSFFSFFIFTSSLQETEILLTFKNSIQDPSNSLSTWSNNSLTHFCNWVGITCSTKTPPSITSLNLQNLNLSGQISSSVCKLPNLSHLNLANNVFNQPIPLHLSQCSSLQSLNLSNNLIWGTIPDQVSLFSSLKALDVSKNHIEGKIPDNLGNLKNLEILNLASNLFTGNLPSYVFGNLTELIVLDLSENPFLSSEIPVEIGKFGKLKQLLLQKSGFYGLIPDSLVSLHGLEILDLSQNNLTGVIPPGLRLSLQNLVSLDVSQNKLSGSFPTDACKGKGLINLSLHTNSFTGLVSEALEECLNLERFQVQNNEFSGDFPKQLWSLPKIKLIRAENNRFSGEIADSISEAANLEQVQIDNNKFTGVIPRGLGLVKSLYRFSASVNSLYGDLPLNFCDSPVMSIINLSHNLISGRIPQLTKCRKLVSLALADNNLVGEIPTSLAHLPVLTYLDLSDNNITGPIPQELQNLKLAQFNVSYNKLSGKVPLSLISGLPASSLEGNPDLCGPGLPNSCSDENGKPPARHSKLAYILIMVAFAVGIMVFATILTTMYWSSNRKSRRSNWNSVFFYPLKITEDDIMRVIDSKVALQGRGTFGGVHVIQSPSGEFFAVKKLMNNGSLSLKKLKAEMKTLAKIRHKNITKLLGFFLLEDSVILIYEFVPMGSLGDLICKLDTRLEWGVRLKIAIGAAQGLAYLHKDYVPQLLHRNIKSRNILLDSDFEPKLTDYALDRVVGEIGYQATVTPNMTSSCYMAPEQSCSKKATEQMDVYSFGVVLLELVTGRNAEVTQAEDSSIDVVRWVRRKINTTNGAGQVLDPKISNSFNKEMLDVLDIALLCTCVVPEKRPAMSEVVRSLQSLDSRTQFSSTFCSETELSTPSKSSVQNRN